jgi:hypothetical protein
MKLVCPSCGAVASAEAWVNDAEARQAIRLVSELPESVSRRALPYLALFRPMTGKGLRWQTALKHLAELERLVREPTIQWEGRPARPNDSRLWGQGMDQVVERPPQKLPLKSHGYLKAIVYDLANEADRQAEIRRNQTEASGRIRTDGHVNVGPERITYEQMVDLRRRKEKRDAHQNTER